MNTTARRFALTVTLAAVAALAACQRKPPAQPQPPAASPAPATPKAAPTAEADVAPPPGTLRAYVWTCDGGQVLKMRNLFRENAIAIDVHEGTRKLPHVLSADGAKYQDDEVTFWTKGGEATFERKGSPSVKCREDRAASLREDARIRGVAFRGQGNEPGWTLEVGPGNHLAWDTNYGQEKHAYDNAQSSGDAASGLVYTGQDATTILKVTITQAPCQDDMSGQAFDYTFALDAGGGRVYRGCGAKL